MDFGRLNEAGDKFLVAYEAVQRGSSKFDVKAAFNPAREDAGWNLADAKGIETARKDFGGTNRPYNIAILPAEREGTYGVPVSSSGQSGRLSAWCRCALWSLNNGAAAYTYSADGGRVRKEVARGGTEYFYFGGRVISKRNVATGDWSHYIYAAGKRIAKADSFENGIMIQGNNCSNCGLQHTWFTVNDAQYLSGYTIQAGDKLYFCQYQANARGGMASFSGMALMTPGTPSIRTANIRMMILISGLGTSVAST